MLPLGVEECQGNAGFVCKQFSLGPILKRLGAACISAAQFEQNREGREVWFGFSEISLLDFAQYN